MKAKMEDQPFATLAALGVKTILTADFDPFASGDLERGERIAIVASATMPPLGAVGGWWCRRDPGHWTLVPSHVPSEHLMHPSEAEIDLPLGAVACTVTVEDALPILTAAQADATVKSCLASYDDGGLARWLVDPHGTDHCQEVADQLPLGDFTPGRWGWLLSDPQPCDPIPCKGRQGVFVLPDDEEDES